MIDLDYTVLFQASIFLILMTILHHLLFKPYKRLFEEREHMTDGLKKEVEAVEREFQAKSAEFDGRIREAHLKAAEEIEDLRAEAQEAARVMIAEARRKSVSQIEAATSELRREAVEARERLVKESDSIGMLLAEKVLGRKIA
jgi:F-type H+-transporting ATPase subunit b